MLDSGRRANFEKLSAIFEPYKKYFHVPAATEKADPCWFAYLLTIREDAPFSRNDIVSHLEDAKIQTRSYFSGNILAHPGYIHLADEYGDMNETFPNAQLVTTNSFFLGTYVGLTDEKMAYIKEAVDNFFEGI
jgi:CDP-6-deoxy-D-xylo-4-hexulose-3-dehydrase